MNNSLPWYRSWRRLLPLALGTLLLGSAGCKENKMDSRELLVAQELLGRVLSAATAAEYAEALRIHGPVHAEEVPLLADKAQSSEQTVRRNAVRLLSATTKGDAPAVLRKLIRKTEDPVVFVLAADGLLRDPDGPSQCADRPELLAAALADSEPRSLSAALRVGACAKAPGIHAAIAKALQHPNEDVRYAAVEALEKVGIGPLAPALKAILNERSPEKNYPFAMLYRLLVEQDDPELGAAFKNSLKGANNSQVADLINAVASSRKPWVRQFLLELANTEGMARWPAFVTLSAWGSATERELLTICIAALEKTPPKSEEQKRWMYLVDIVKCRKYLGQLAGRDIYTPEEADAALAFARQRLAGH